MKIKDQIKKYRLRFGLTLLLILTEAGIGILFPLFIGNAIDDALKGQITGTVHLGLLGLVALVIGVGRRVFDSRFYAVIFQDLGAKMVDNHEESAPSVKTARLGMIRELVEFMENALPELINTLIGLFGVIAIIATLNFNIFLSCLITGILVMSVYAISSGKTTRLNESLNDEMERQVDIISTNEHAKVKLHLKDIMKWNIKLSDLEAVNFSISWILLIGFLVSSLLILISDGMLQHGALFALMMYAFQFMENVLNLPLFYQNWLRLKEIIGRLENPGN